jgi:uncharacterized RDD family membrane protein YckC
MQMPTHAGWFDDPDDPNQLRYFDGVIWTSHTTPRATRPAASETPQPYAQPSAHQRQPGAWQAPYGGRQPNQPQMPQYQGGWNVPGYGVPSGVPSTPDGQPLASYFQRVGAYLLDLLIEGVIAVVLGGWLLYKAMQPFFDAFGRAMASNDQNAIRSVDAATTVNYGYLLAFTLLTVAIQFTYAVVFLSRTGATPGKAALGISVRLRERPGPLSVADACKRASLQSGLSLLGNIPYLGTAFSLVGLLDLLWPAWDGRRQALHDKLAATNVVIGRQPRR